MKLSKVKKYTVLLAYPDYLAEDWGATCTYHVLACDPTAAVSAARVYALSANDMEAHEAYDFAVIAVYHGHLTNQNPER